MDVAIVGAGLAGLSCARELAAQGFQVTVFEASDDVGGRVRTDLLDGFQLDRGFQVFLTSYPEAQRQLDYDALQLRPFLPGAWVRCRGRFYEFADPWRRPLAGLRSLLAPIGTWQDKLRIAKLRGDVTRGNWQRCWQVPEVSTHQALRERGFSRGMIEQFFQPFLGGIFLDRELQTSNRMFEFVFRMFSTGNASLPAAGMSAIPRQMARQLPDACLKLNCPVRQVDANSVQLVDGTDIRCRAVVVATDGATARQLLPPSHRTVVPSIVFQAVTCLYFVGTDLPLPGRSLWLNGEGVGPINNIAVPTAVSPSYGPAGQHLISVTVLGSGQPDLLAHVRQQLADWFGPATKAWRHLKTYEIPRALPNQFAGALAEPERPVRLAPGLVWCGDHCDQASIQGALVSGVRAAQAVAQELCSRTVN